MPKKDYRHNQTWKETINERVSEDQQKFLDAIEENPNIQLACKKAVISRSTVYRWREDMRFAKRMDLMQGRGKERLHDFVESKLLQKINQDTGWAVRFYLDRHHPDYMQGPSFRRDQLRREEHKKAVSDLLKFMSQTLGEDKFRKEMNFEVLKKLLDMGSEESEENEGDPS